MTPCFRAVFAAALAFSLVTLNQTPVAAEALKPLPRPIKLIVPFPSGGSTDAMARIIKRQFGEVLGTELRIETISGAGGTIGSAVLSKSPNDGTVLGVLPAATLVSQPYRERTAYTAEDFTYICQVFESPMALAVRPNAHYHTLSEMIEFARAHPGAVTYGSPGPASLAHLAMEALMEEVDIKLTHVPFQGDKPGITALLGEHIDLYMIAMANVLKRNLPALAVFSDERSPSAPSLPTSREAGIKTEATWWGGIVAPKNMPASLQQRFETACRTMVEAPKFHNRLDALGTTARFRGGRELHNEVRSAGRRNAQILARILP